MKPERCTVVDSGLGRLLQVMLRAMDEMQRAWDRGEQEDAAATANAGRPGMLLQSLWMLSCPLFTRFVGEEVGSWKGREMHRPAERDDGLGAQMRASVVFRFALHL